MIIRRVPTDFRVLEHLNYEVRDVLCASHTPGSPVEIYEVRKQSLTTQEASQRLAKALGVKGGTVQAAGLKDKHAVTTQFMSVERPGAPDPLGNGDWIKPAGLGEVEIRLAGFYSRHLVAADIARNEFEIVVRDASDSRMREMDRRAKALRNPRTGTIRFPNYFGDQRFAGVKRGDFIAKHLIKGDFEGALKLAIGTPARKESGSRKVLTRAAATHWGHWKQAVRASPASPSRKPLELLAAGADFKEAFAALPYLDQQMAVEAYQSHLWNQTATCLILKVATKKGELAPQQLLCPFGQKLPADTKFHSTHGPKDLKGKNNQYPGQKNQGAKGKSSKGQGSNNSAEPADEHDAGSDAFQHLYPAAALFDGAGPFHPINTLEFPMPAANTLRQAPWGECLEQVLDSESIAISELRIPGMRRPAFSEAMRPLFATAMDVEVGSTQPDELATAKNRLKRTLRFSLPRGCYATIVLEALGQ